MKSLTLKSVAVLAVLFVLTVAVPTVSTHGGSTPYLPALSSLAATPALASSTCQNHGCTLYGTCNRTKGFNCRRAAGECQATAC